MTNQTRRFRVVDQFTGEAVEVTVKEIAPPPPDIRTSMLESMSEDLHENWSIPGVVTVEEDLAETP